MFYRKSPIINTHNAISELLPIQLGNLQQWIYIRGENKEKPILLMLHGGPGAAQIGFIRKFQHNLEKHFVVVNWDQRGAGLSYSKNIPLASMNINQFVDDTLQLSDYLRDRFKRRKIYLFGHSWGTILGILAIAKQPERFIRYFGVAQVTNLMAAEQLSYQLLLERAKTANNQKAVVDLEKIGPPPWDDLKKDRIHQKYVEMFGGGLTKDGQFVSTILKELLLSKEYTLLDVCRLLKGQYFSLKALQNEMQAINFTEQIKKIAIPIHFYMGRHDLTAPYQPTAEFFQNVEAPEKDWEWFEHSAHSPSIEESEKFIELIVCATEKDLSY